MARRFMSCDPLGRRGTVILVRTATGTAGRSPDAIAVTPDGQTVLVANVGNPAPNTVTPISTRTGSRTADQAARLPNAIAITPDGTTAYVAGAGRVVTIPGKRMNAWRGVVTPIRIRPCARPGRSRSATTRSWGTRPRMLWCSVLTGRPVTSSTPVPTAWSLSGPLPAGRLGRLGPATIPCPLWSRPAAGGSTSPVAAKRV
jgi:hypothetical protein